MSPPHHTPSSSGGVNVHWSESEEWTRQQATKGSLSEDPTTFEANSAMSSSSAMASARDVGIDLKMTIPPRVHGYAWHIGNRPENPRAAVGRVCELISLQSSLPFFSIYFDEVNMLFGALVHDDFMKRCTSSWGSGGGGPDFEAIICGVITLGSLFSNSNPCPMELELIELARRLLVSSLSATPAPVTLDHVAAWILRSLYLRLTTRPHLSWLSTCTTLHLAESVGLHQEMDDAQLYRDDPHRNLDVIELESRRRVFWVALSLNRILSAEYGRSRVHVENISCRKPIRRRGDFTNDLIDLTDLLPGGEAQGSESARGLAIAKGLDQLSQLSGDNPAFIILKADVCLILCRRLRLTDLRLSAEQISSIMSILRIALVHARFLSDQQRPWWNVLSVPFHSVCLLLSTSFSDGIGLLSEAMEALLAVSRIYDTHLAREAVKTAQLLIRQAAERKREDLIILDGLCQSPGSSNLRPNESNGSAPSPFLFDALTDEDLNWAQFFTSDIMTQRTGF